MCYGALASLSWEKCLSTDTLDALKIQTKPEVATKIICLMARYLRIVFVKDLHCIHVCSIASF